MGKRYENLDGVCTTKHLLIYGVGMRKEDKKERLVIHFAS